jgi:glycine cleavage system P protein (glycine dehydrogenase) subunit 1
MRYLPHTNDEIQKMLAAIGVADVEELFATIPKELRCDPELDLPEGIGEQELWAHLIRLASANRPLSSSASFLGAGAYRHYIPAAVAELASRSEFVTPYTPYQPEISQGTLQAIFEYQSQICRLFAMGVSNASHYSGATALADAALMARRVGKGRSTIIVPDNVHPEYRRVLATVLPFDEDVRVVPAKHGLVDRSACAAHLDAKAAAIVVQFPNFFGIVEELADVATMAHDAGALLIACVPEPSALGILSPPGAWGADIAVGEGLSLGLPVSFGGPTLGIFTTREALVRQMPGRICGKTVDAEGRAGYVLTLSTREQHIRREKATSNICSNQALCATTAAIYLAMVGKEGMRELATINAATAAFARERLTQVPGVKPLFSAPSFNEFAIGCPHPASEVLARLADQGILGGIDLGHWYEDLSHGILVCATELTTRDEIERYAQSLAKVLRS